MEPLSDEKIEMLRQALLRRRDEIATGLATAADAARPVDLGEPIGRVSRIDAIQQQQMARASHEALLLRRQQIDAALGAIEGGRYGECRRCEEPVGFARLQATPEAPFCLDCQAEIERK